MGIGYIGIEGTSTPAGGGVVIIIEDRGNTFDTIHISDEVVPLRFNKGHQIKTVSPPGLIFWWRNERDEVHSR